MEDVHHAKVLPDSGFLCWKASVAGAVVSRVWGGDRLQDLLPGAALPAQPLSRHHND